MWQVSRSAAVSPAEGSIDESVQILALCLNSEFIRFILSLQPFTFLIPDLFYLTVTVSLWPCFSSYAEALMYLIYSYQYNKELLSKGLYRGHSEELLGHYRRECLLVSRRSSWNNMSNPRGKQAVCLFLSSKLNKLQNGHRHCFLTDASWACQTLFLDSHSDSVCPSLLNRHQTAPVKVTQQTWPGIPPAALGPTLLITLLFFLPRDALPWLALEPTKDSTPPPLAPHLIMTNENPFSVTKQEPHFISARRAQSCALLLLVSAAGFVGLISLKLVF